MSAYQLAKEAQLKRNKALLLALGLPSIINEVSALKPQETPGKKKRSLDSPEKKTPTPKAARTSTVDSPAGTRSSGRIKSLAKKKEYEEAIAAEKALRRLESNSESEAEEKERDETAAPKSLSGPRANPKVFGNQKGVPVGKTWGFRMDASQDGIHAPVVAGISGSETAGAWSIALSGGYEDDIDLGFSFTFTGSGGRDLKGTKANPKNLRTAPQSSDQEFTGVNQALKRSAETKKPVRVIRGFKGKSCFAPESGYRYDGLYKVTKAWQDMGEAGFKVCRYAFVRLDGQPDIPIRPGREAEAAAIKAQFGGEVADSEQDTLSPVASSS